MIERAYDALVREFDFKTLEANAHLYPAVFKDLFRQWGTWNPQIKIPTAPPALPADLDQAERRLVEVWRDRQKQHQGLVYEERGCDVCGARGRHVVMLADGRVVCAAHDALIRMVGLDQYEAPLAAVDENHRILPRLSTATGAPWLSRDRDHRPLPDSQPPRRSIADEWARRR